MNKDHVVGCPMLRGVKGCQCPKPKEMLMPKGKIKPKTLDNLMKNLPPSTDNFSGGYETGYDKGFTDGREQGKMDLIKDVKKLFGV